MTDYLSVISEPMDLSTMARKVREHEYTSLRELVSVFELMVQNCLTYNGPATLFYKAGVKLRDAVSLAISQSVTGICFCSNQNGSVSVLHSVLYC